MKILPIVENKNFSDDELKRRGSICMDCFDMSVFAVLNHSKKNIFLDGQNLIREFHASKLAWRNIYYYVLENGWDGCLIVPADYSPLQLDKMKIVWLDFLADMLALDECDYGYLSGNEGQEVNLEFYSRAGLEIFSLHPSKWFNALLKLSNIKVCHEKLPEVMLKEKANFSPLYKQILSIIRANPNQPYWESVNQAFISLKFKDPFARLHWTESEPVAIVSSIPLMQLRQLLELLILRYPKIDFYLWVNKAQVTRLERKQNLKEIFELDAQNYDMKGEKIFKQGLALTHQHGDIDAVEINTLRALGIKNPHRLGLREATIQRIDKIRELWMNISQLYQNVFSLVR